MDSPRGRIQLMESHLDGTISLNETVTHHFDLCLGCMACVTACPSGVQYDKLIEATRETIETTTRRPIGDRLVRGALFKLLPYPRRMGTALRLAPIGRKLPLPGRLRVMTEIAPPWRSTERPEKSTPARGETRGRVGILTGCVQSVVFGSVNAATARVLAADGYEVVAPAQGCCGALSLHAGRGDEGRAFARRAIEAFEGVETVIVNTSGCGSHLKELGHVLGDDPAWAERAAAFSRRVRDLGEFLEGVTPRAPRHPLNLRVAMQDSCHLRHAQRLPLSSRCRSGGSPASRCSSPPSRTSAAGAPGSTTSPSLTLPASSATARPRMSSRRAPRSMRVQTRAASSRSRRHSAGRGARCPRCTRSRSSMRRSGTSARLACCATPGAEPAQVPVRQGPAASPLQLRSSPRAATRRGDRHPQAPERNATNRRRSRP